MRQCDAKPRQNLPEDSADDDLVLEQLWPPRNSRFAYSDDESSFHSEKPLVRSVSSRQALPKMVPKQVYETAPHHSRHASNAMKYRSAEKLHAQRNPVLDILNLSSRKPLWVTPKSGHHSLLLVDDDESQGCPLVDKHGQHNLAGRPPEVVREDRVDSGQGNLLRIVDYNYYGDEFKYLHITEDRGLENRAEPFLDEKVMEVIFFDSYEPNERVSIVEEIAKPKKRTSRLRMAWNRLKRTFSFRGNCR